MTIQKIRKVKVALKLDEKTTLQLIDFCYSVHQSMLGNTYFPAPNPTLTDISTALTALEISVNAPKPHKPDQTADILAKRGVLENLMTWLGAYVEGVVNLDPVNSVTILQSTGIERKKDPKARLNGFRLIEEFVPGQVKLATDMVKGAGYKWQYSLSQNEEGNWSSVVGNLTRIVIPDLLRGQRYFFRVAVIQKYGAGPWSYVISTIVL
jgi:hypothetical protein